MYMMRKKSGKIYVLGSIRLIWPTLDKPKPSFTPNPRRSHHKAAPAMPAAPVPLDQAPRAVRDAVREGKVVVSCRKVNSPNPEERDAIEIPNNLGYNEDEKATI